MTLYLRSVSVLTAYPGEADELFFGFLSSGAQWEWRSKVITTEKYNQEWQILVKAKNFRNSWIY